MYLLFPKLASCINGLRLSEPALRGQEKPKGARQIKSKELRRRHSALNLVPVRVHQGNTRNAISKLLPPRNHTCLADKTTEPSPALQRGWLFFFHPFIYSFSPSLFSWNWPTWMQINSGWSDNYAVSSNCHVMKWEIGQRVNAKRISSFLYMRGSHIHVRNSDLALTCLRPISRADKSVFNRWHLLEHHISVFDFFAIFCSLNDTSLITVFLSCGCRLIIGDPGLWFRPLTHYMIIGSIQGGLWYLERAIR